MPSTWFVTGFSSGLGLEIAIAALDQGHAVIGTVRDRQRAAAEVARMEEKGGKVLELDVTHADACFDVWHAAEVMYGHIDVLCNAAGMSYAGALEDFTDEEVNAQMNVNFYGPYRLIRASLPGFRKNRGGTIINVSSVSGFDGAIASGLYAASKFALEGLSEGLAQELAEYNVQVLIVEPGAFRTNFLTALKMNSKKHLEHYSTAKKTIGVFEAFHGKQRGDPVKAAERLVEVVDGQGSAGHLKGKVLRLPLGPDCFQRCQTKISTMSTDLDMVKEVAISTDI